MSEDYHLGSKKQLEKTDVENLINEASNPDNYANRDLDIPEQNLDQFMDKLQVEGQRSDDAQAISQHTGSPEPSRLENQTRLKSNYDSKSQLVERTVSETPPNITNTNSKAGDTSKLGDKSANSQISKKSVFVQSLRPGGSRAYSVSPMIDMKNVKQKVPLINLKEGNEPASAGSKQGKRIKTVNSTALDDKRILITENILQDKQDNEFTQQTDFTPLVD